MNTDLKPFLCASVALCWRIVETQEKAATREITDTAEEQSRLELLLDEVKPPVPEDCQGLSYLLMTPFRYPPLRYGSRFGSPWERGIFYGSTALKTACAESAVYFWLFQSGPINMGALETIRDHRTALSVRLASERVLRLETIDFGEQGGELNNPASWGFTQALGKASRALDAEFMTYPSARLNHDLNVAVLSPKSFACSEPDEQQLWYVRLSKEVCWFGRPDGESVEFYRKDFEVDGQIPHPSLAQMSRIKIVR